MELPFKMVFQFEIFLSLYCLCDEVSMKCGNKKTWYTLRMNVSVILNMKILKAKNKGKICIKTHQIQRINTHVQ